MPKICLQEDLKHGLRVRNLLPTVFHYALFEGLRSWRPLFAFGTFLSRSVGCAFAAVDLLYLLII